MLQTRTAGRGIFLDAPTISWSFPSYPRRRSIYRASLTKLQAEEWLDWLEANGYPSCQVSYVAGKGFTVSCSDRGGAMVEIA